MNIRGIFLMSVLLLAGIPFSVHAQVQINEIAWMGSVESANAEWIELYNDSNAEITLDGWMITAYDGSPKINLVGSIGAQDYYLLERTSDNSVPEILADSIYSGSLGNTGERLQLIDANGTIIQDLDFTDGWPAGDNSNKYTMQWVNDTWASGIATPGTENSASDTASDIVSTSGSGTISASGSTATSASSSKKISGVEVTPVEPNHTYSAQLQIPDYGVVGVPIEIKVLVTQDKKRDMVSGRFNWYTGDGGAYQYFKNTVVTHQFMYPGEYTVVLEYYSNSMKEEIDSIHKKKILIIPDTLAIESVTNNGGVTIKNSSSRDIDLHKWIMMSNKASFIIPKYTVVKKGGYLTLPKGIHGLVMEATDRVMLVNPTGVVVSSFEYAMLSP